MSGQKKKKHAALEVEVNTSARIRIVGRSHHYGETSILTHILGVLQLAFFFGNTMSRKDRVLVMVCWSYDIDTLPAGLSFQWISYSCKLPELAKATAWSKNLQPRVE